MEQKPRIFIGSSKENVKYAHAIHMFLNNQYAYTKLWETAVKTSEYTLPALIKTFEEYDYGIFIFSEDDIVKIRKKNYQTVRDNVLFEFGLFIGKHGLENAF
ncbi:MAG: nucleotide-binding protein, partial [Candidatus Nanoarchaeia archaeon]|nr:nucleotide-binding protein [Candidatus Nanoarchaeia archaeon]